MKVYFAGPDVFRYDAPSYFYHELQNKCEKEIITPLIPLDFDLTQSIDIYQKNISLIKECDVVLANLDPFRGPSLDSGTAFEIGYAIAINKIVIGYYTYDAFLSYKDRMEPVFWEYSKEYPLIEDFGLSDNLMIIHSCQYVVNSIDEAIKLSKTIFTDHKND